MWALSSVITVLAFIAFGVEAVVVLLPALVVGEFAYVLATGRDSDDVVESGARYFIKQ